MQSSMKFALVVLGWGLFIILQLDICEGAPSPKRATRGPSPVNVQKTEDFYLSVSIYNGATQTVHSLPISRDSKIIMELVEEPKN